MPYCLPSAPIRGPRKLRKRPHPPPVPVPTIPPGQDHTHVGTIDLEKGDSIALSYRTHNGGFASYQFTPSNFRRAMKYGTQTFSTIPRRSTSSGGQIKSNTEGVLLYPSSVNSIGITLHPASPRKSQSSHENDDEVVPRTHTAFSVEESRGEPRRSRRSSQLPAIPPGVLTEQPTNPPRSRETGNHSHSRRPVSSHHTTRHDSSSERPIFTGTRKPVPSASPELRRQSHVTHRSSSRV